MEGPPAPGTLCAAPVEDVVDAVRDAIDASRPDVVVTLDGSDGHRDHPADPRRRAARCSPTGAPLYLQCLPRSLMHAWVRLQADNPDAAAYVELPDIGTPDE